MFPRLARGRHRPPPLPRWPNNLRHFRHSASCLSSAAFPSTSLLSSRKPKWGLFSDIHFQQEDLSRIIESSQWITSTFRQHEVTQIFCLGDVLNTRENVNVQALSATTRFFDDLRSVAPVHIVLGNHDMNLKHSASLSSLDFFDMRSFRQGGEGGRLYRDMTEVEIEGVKCLMVPWVENHQKIVDNFMEMPNEKKTDTVVFGHMAVSGAIQQPAQRVGSRYRKHVGVLKGRHLADFKSVYLGHFHHHQGLGEEPYKVWYVGAPLQHHFGDKEDDKRGVLIVDPEITPAENVSACTFVQNPDWDFFREVSLGELKSAEVVETSKGVLVPNLPWDLKRKRIHLRCNAVDVPDFEVWRKKLLEAGASDVRRKIEIGKGVTLPQSKETKGPGEEEEGKMDGHDKLPDLKEPPASVQQEETLKAPTTTTFIESLPAFLKTIPEESELIPLEEREDYITFAARIMRQADPVSSTSTLSSLPIFHATFRTLTIKNFFSVQGTLTIQFWQLSPGIWFLTGPNGAGKSTVLEAITWCLFGRVLRSDMGAGDPVNDFRRKACAVRVEFENGYAIERTRQFSAKGIGLASLKVYKNGKELENFERGQTQRSQEALERDILGCDFGMFTKTVIFGDQGAGAGNFLTLEKSARREVLEELLGISNFEGYLRTVRDEKRAAEKAHDKLLAAIEGMAMEHSRSIHERNAIANGIKPKETAKKKLEKSVKALDIDMESFEQDRLKIEQHQGELLKWNSVYENLRRAMDRESRLSEDLLNRTKTQNDLLLERGKVQMLKPMRAKWAVLGREIELLQVRKERNDLEVRGTRVRLNELSKTITKVGKGVTKGICPTCQQSLDNSERIHSHLEELKCKQEELEQNLTTLTRQENELKELMAQKWQEQEKILAEQGVSEVYFAGLLEREAELTTAIHAQDRPLKRIRADLQSTKMLVGTILDGRTPSEIASLAQRDNEEDSSSFGNVMESHNKLLSRIQALSTRRVELASALAKLEAELELAKSRVTQMDQHIEELSERLEEDTKRANELQRTLRMLLFWETAFSKKQSTTTSPNMRHFLIASSIDELNVLIKTNMDILTSPTSLSAFMALENAGDTPDTVQPMKINIPISFTPDLSIHPPSSFGKRSSGQRKRNNLAVLFALFQLIRQKSRFRADFIMLDEVFDALDSEGQVQAAELIASVAGEGEVKHVLVVTHSERLEDVIRVGGGGSRVMRVEMTDRGTRIWDPEGWVEHNWGISSEDGVPELDAGEGKAGKRKSTRKPRKKVVEEQLVEEQLVDATVDSAGAEAATGV